MEHQGLLLTNTCPSLEMKNFLEGEKQESSPGAPGELLRSKHKFRGDRNKAAVLIRHWSVGMGLTLQARAMLPVPSEDNVRFPQADAGPEASGTSQKPCLLWGAGHPLSSHTPASSCPLPTDGPPQVPGIWQTDQCSG